MPNEVATFQQFRARYPSGSLSSELVMMQEQAFVVRVQLQLEDHISVTALAADTVLEVAEDRARQRALDLLGLSAYPGHSNPQVVPPPASKPKTIESPKPVITSAAPPLAIAAEPELPAEEADLTPPLDLIPDPGAQALPESPPVPNSEPQGPAAKTTVPAQITQGQTAIELLPMPAPIDLSDVIAQTDVELKRLVWSVKDGRDYLEQTYGKRSRHDLTDEELLAFLLHLESLPTPVTP
ncbi:MAG: hypothetical protein AAGF24_14895 [Cyanobacteria bacterium P01_H01_bin.121]